MTAANPFEVFRSIKSAVLTSSLRSAEKALRSAEAARRTALEDTIADLKKQTEDMKQQVAQTASTAAESSALAQSLANPPPIPPAAQPQYGSMAMVGPDGQPLATGAQPGQSQAATASPTMGAMPKVPGMSMKTA